MNIFVLINLLSILLISLAILILYKYSFTFFINLFSQVKILPYNLSRILRYILKQFSEIYFRTYIIAFENIQILDCELQVSKILSHVFGSFLHFKKIFEMQNYMGHCNYYHVHILESLYRVFTKNP